MLTHKIIKTISVNLGVNYRQFEVIFCLGWKNALAHWQPQTKLKMIDLMVKVVIIYKVYLSIGTLEFALTSIIPENLKMLSPTL